MTVGKEDINSATPNEKSRIAIAAAKKNKTTKMQNQHRMRGRMTAKNNAIERNHYVT